MKWLDEAPESWDQAPEQPPAAAPDDVSTDVFPDGVLLHEPGSKGAFIYAREGEMEIEEYA